MWHEDDVEIEDEGRSRGPFDTLAGLARNERKRAEGLFRRRAVKIPGIFNERRLINGLRRHPLHIPYPYPFAVPFPFPFPAAVAVAV